MTKKNYRFCSSTHLLFLTFCCLLCSASTFSQWAKGIGGNWADYGKSITTDAAGNVYVIGDFSGKADFDPSAGTYYLTSSCPCDESDPPIADVFFAKYTSAGALVWARKVGGGGTDFGKGIGVDANGNVYITGYFEGTADFDPSSNTRKLVSHGNYDIFLAKYNSSGNIIWAKNIGGILPDVANGLSVSSTGVVTIAGAFADNVDFDPGAGTAVLNAGDRSEPFFARYNTNGKLVWVKEITGDGESSAESIFIDRNGAIYITGNFFGTSDFNAGAGNFTLTGAGSKDPFFAKYTATGNFIWAASIGSLGDETGQSITADTLGNAYITGYFANTLDFNPGAGVFNLSSKGLDDAYLLKLNKNGAFVWATSIGGSVEDIGLSVTVDASQHVYAAGYFANTASFGTSATLTSTGDVDVYFAKYNATGQLLWAKKNGGTSGDWGGAITTDAQGFVYLTGYYTGTAVFQTGASTTSLTSAGNADVFLLKYQQATTQTTSNTFITAAVNTKSTDEHVFLEQVQLRQNEPNPFYQTTRIVYYLPRQTRIRLSLFDMAGKEVRVLADGEKGAGQYTVELKGDNLNSGIYTYRLQTPALYITKKLVLMKGK